MSHKTHPYEGQRRQLPVSVPLYLFGWKPPRTLFLFFLPVVVLSLLPLTLLLVVASGGVASDHTPALNPTKQKHTFVQEGEGVSEEGKKSSLSGHPESNEGDSVLFLSKAPSFSRIPHDEALEPSEGQPFLVSLTLQLRSLPRPGEQPLLVSKYLGAKAPYPGWALSLSNHDTSLRPGLYLRSQAGRGGWFYFDDISVQRGRWYSLTLLVSGRDSATMYLQEVLHSETSPVLFLGGAELGQLGDTATNEPVIFGNLRGERDFVRIAMVDVLIARPRKVPREIREGKKFVDGGSGEIRKRLSPEEIQLFVGRRERDESPFGREVAIGGEARWERLQESKEGDR